MAIFTLDARQQQKIDTLENWKLKNPILLKAEFGIESITNRIKIGDGATAWKQLPYFGTLGIAKYVKIISCDGNTSSFTITHNLGTSDIGVTIIDLSTNEIISSSKKVTIKTLKCSLELTLIDENTIEMSFSNPPSEDEVYKVVIVG